MIIYCSGVVILWYFKGCLRLIVAPCFSETTAKLTVEDQPESDKKASGSDSITVIPVSPTSSSGVLKEDVVKSNSDYSSLSSETAGKRKTPPSKVMCYFGVI